MGSQRTPILRNVYPQPLQGLALCSGPQILGEHGYQRYGDSASVYRPGKVG